MCTTNVSSWTHSLATSLSVIRLPRPSGGPSSAAKADRIKHLGRRCLDPSELQAGPTLFFTRRRHVDDWTRDGPFTSPQTRQCCLGAGGSAPTADDDCRCSCLTATATPAGCARGRREQLVRRAALAEGTAGSFTAERLHFDAAKDGRREQAPLRPRCWACANCRRGRDCPT